MMARRTTLRPQRPARPSTEISGLRKAAHQILTQSAEGRRVLQEHLVLEHRHGVKFQERPLNYFGVFSGSDNTLTMTNKLKLSAFDYARTLVHEGTHGNQNHDIQSERDGVFRNAEEFETAEDYTHNMLRLEAAAVARSTEVRASLGFQGDTDLSNIFLDTMATSPGATYEQKRQDAIEAMHDYLWSTTKFTYREDSMNYWHGNRAVAQKFAERDSAAALAPHHDTISSARAEAFTKLSVALARNAAPKGYFRLSPEHLKLAALVLSKTPTSTTDAHAIRDAFEHVMAGADLTPENTSAIDEVFGWALP